MNATQIVRAIAKELGSAEEWDDPGYYLEWIESMITRSNMFPYSIGDGSGAALAFWEEFEP